MTNPPDINGLIRRLNKQVEHCEKVILDNEQYRPRKNSELVHETWTERKRVNQEAIQALQTLGQPQ